MFRLAILFCTVTVTLANVYSLAPPGYLYAVDFIPWGNWSVFSCMGYQDNSYSTSVSLVNDINGMNGTESIDVKLFFNVHAAREAELETEFYLYPLISTGLSGTTQFNRIFNNLKANGIKLTFIWIKVDPMVNWYPDYQRNVNLLKDVRDAAMAKNVRVGFYTSANYWTKITGNYAGFASDNLWYISNNGDGADLASPADFKDFKPFGGWKKPNRKQFASNMLECDIYINKSIYEATP